MHVPLCANVVIGTVDYVYMCVLGHLVANPNGCGHV